MGLRAKIAAALLAWSLLIIAAVSILQINHTIVLMADGLANSGELIINEIFEQVRATLAGSRGDVVVTLQRSPALRTLIESSGAFAQGVVYVRLETIGGVPILSEPPQNLSADLPAAAPFSALLKLASSWLGLARIYFAWGGGTYEMTRVLEIDGQPFVVIRVGLSTALTVAEVHNSVAHIALIGAAVSGFALLGAIILGSLLLRPVAAIAVEVEELAAGRETKALKVAGRDELSSLADKFNALSERISTDRSQWEHERSQLFDAFRSITDAVILLDARGAILFANQEATGRLGLPAGGMVEGKPLRALLGKGHPLSRMVEITFATGNHANDVPMQLADGDEPVRLLVSIFSLGQGPEPAGLIIIARDMQAVQELKRTLDYSSRLARLGGLISGIGHQLRTPLNSMNVHLELLSEDLAHQRPGATRIAGLRGEVKRLDRAVDALLRFLRPQQLELTQLNPSQLLEEIARRLTPATVKLELDLDRRLPPIAADRDLLEEALTNIINNAIEAMAEGGSLRIASRADADGYVRLSISDTGCGIDPAQMQHIFQLYFTTKASGNGLGLALALRAIDLHQGIIDVDSNPGKGTTVTIRLPRASAVDSILAAS